MPPPPIQHVHFWCRMETGLVSERMFGGYPKRCGLNGSFTLDNAIDNANASGAKETPPNQYHVPLQKVVPSLIKLRVFCLCALFFIWKLQSALQFASCPEWVIFFFLEWVVSQFSLQTAVIDWFIQVGGLLADFVLICLHTPTPLVVPYPVPVEVVLRSTCV